MTYSVTNRRPATLSLKSALVGVGFAIVATFASASAAQADNFSFGFSIGDRHGPSIHGHFGDRKHYRGGPVYHDRAVRRSRCSPQRALRKARHAGVRHARLVRYGPRGAVVAGRYRGDRVIARINRKCNVRRIVYR